MDHSSEFFDRAVFDQLWSVSWKTLLKQNPRIAWLHSQKWPEVGAYYGNSLRELLALCVDPEQSPKQIEAILENEKVTDTLVRCSPQFFAMGELMDHAVSHSKKSKVRVEIHDVLPLTYVATLAFLSKDISSATLWSVLKLHGIRLTDLPRGSQLKERCRALLPWHRFWDPIYSWQGKKFKEDEWSSCLGVADTRRFISFVLRAEEENWATELPSPKSNTSGPLRFRDDPYCMRLSKCMIDLPDLLYQRDC